MSNNVKTADRLWREAKKVRLRAHAPYSGFRVGAAIRLADGSVHSGCNVENASYGGTVCAERVAVFKAVSEGAKKPIVEVCVVTDQAEPWPPCGFCRQILAEFAGPDLVIWLASTKGIRSRHTLGELLPEAFSPAHLKKR